VARLGGDEFVVLLPDVKQIADVDLVARKLLEALMPTYALGDAAVAATPSIGISTYPEDSGDMDELLRHADAAMYQVKQGGRGNYRFFQGGAGRSMDSD
jgi:diguanylate cyclase (GGDEF)-like protein